MSLVREATSLEMSGTKLRHHCTNAYAGMKDVTVPHVMSVWLAQEDVLFERMCLKYGKKRQPECTFFFFFLGRAGDAWLIKHARGPSVSDAQPWS